MELTLVLTRDCNLGCAYCYAGAKVPSAMPAASGERALAWAVANHRGDERLLVGYFGGEPLLEWDLLTHLHRLALAQAAVRGITLRGTVTTNATLLDDERMAWLADHDVVVGVSIDGRPDSHDRLRPLRAGGPSSPQVLAGLQAALRRQPLTQTISVVDPLNVAQLADNVDFLLDQGVRVIGLGINHRAAWDLDHLDTYRRQLERIGDRFLASYRSGRDLWIEPIDAKIIARVKGGLAACDRCAAGGGELALSPAGRWYPCERMVGDDGEAERRWSLGHLDDTADGGPDPERVAAFRRRHVAMPDACRACAHQGRCQNTCACSNVMASGDPAQPGGVLCATEQAAIAVADRVATTLWNEGNALFLAKQYRLG